MKKFFLAMVLFSSTAILASPFLFVSFSPTDKSTLISAVKGKCYSRGSRGLKWYEISNCSYAGCTQVVYDCY